MSTNSSSLLQAALALAPSVQRPAARSIAYAQIAQAYLSLGDVTQGHEALAFGLQAVESVKYPHEKAIQLAWLGRLFILAGDVKQGKSLLESAVLLARATAPSDKIPAMLEVAREHIAAHLQPEAAGLLAELIQPVAEAEKPEEVSGELIQIAQLYADAGQIDAARETLTRAMKKAAIVQDSWFKAERLTGVAEVFASLKDAAGAVAALVEAGQAAARTESAPGSAYLLLRMVDAYQSLGQVQEATRLLARTLELARQNELPYERSGDLIEIATRLSESENSAESHNLLKESETIIEQIEKPADRAERLADLAAAWAEADRHEEVQRTASLALAAAQTLPDRRASLHIQGELAAVFGQIGLTGDASAIVDNMVQVVRLGQTKTSGLGAIVASLVEASQPELALRLAELIKEPEIKVEALTMIAESTLNGESG